MFSIVAPSLSQDELLSLVGSVDDHVKRHIHFHASSKGLIPSAEATVLASLVGGGAAIAAATINGLFNRWNARINATQSRKSGKPRLVIVLARRTLQMTDPEHLVDSSEVGDGEILEIRLEDL